jgi:cell migration-inducing and hyaluronan-binding protein
LKEAVDWKAGEEIIIASTDFDKDNSEKKTIVSIDRFNPNKPVITLDSVLDFMHYAGVDTYGTDGDFIEIRAEVGLLTRNIKF